MNQVTGLLELHIGTYSSRFCFFLFYTFAEKKKFVFIEFPRRKSDKTIKLWVGQVLCGLIFHHHNKNNNNPVEASRFHSPVTGGSACRSEPEPVPCSGADDL